MKHIASKNKRGNKLDSGAAPPEKENRFGDRYAHQIHLCAGFKGRRQDFSLLSRWALKNESKIIAVTGIGGLGKSTLVGHWLKYHRPASLHNHPVFYWSFYENPSLDDFFLEAIAFCCKFVGTTQGRRNTGGEMIFPATVLTDALRSAPLMLILDGLEVFQKKERSPRRHPRGLDPAVKQLLETWCISQHRGLMIITSRFPLTQMGRHASRGFYHLPLLPLTGGEGAALLENLGVRGQLKLRAAISERYSGHPLALRILAGIINKHCAGSLERFDKEQLVTADAHKRLYQNLQKLLAYYNAQLTAGQRELLGIIGLFHRPVTITRIIGLIKGMASVKNTPLGSASPEKIGAWIKQLTIEFIVEELENNKIICHPIVQNYQRLEFKREGCRREVAFFLQKEVAADQPRCLEEIRDLVQAVHLLCDDEEFEAAHDLCVSRLVRGGFGLDMFKRYTAVSEGLRCCLAFVGDEERQRKTEAALGKSVLAMYMTGVCLYHMQLGDVPNAREWWYKGLKICRTLQKTPHYPMGLQEISNLENALGNIRRAQKIFTCQL